MQLLAFVMYFALILAIGLFFFFRTKNGGEKEYFLGNRYERASIRYVGLAFDGLPR